MKKLLAVLTMACIFACSSDPVEFESATMAPKKETPVPETPSAEVPNPPEEEIPTEGGGTVEMGTFSYSGRVPGGPESKVPTCKDGTPVIVNFELIDAQGQSFTRESPVTDNGGIYTSEPDSLPIGDYQIMATYLMSGQSDTLYSLPTEADTDFLPFADTVLPIGLTIDEDPKTFAGTAMCYNPPNTIVTGELQGGIDAVEISYANLYFNTSTDGFDLCITAFTVDIFRNGSTEPEEIYREELEPRTGDWVSGHYFAPLTRKMDSIWIRSWYYDEYSDEGGLVESERKTVTPDNYPSEHIGDTVWFMMNCN